MFLRIFLVFVIGFLLNLDFANAKSSAKQLETVKKSIIKAIIEDIDEDYLKYENMVNQKWGNEKFYKNTRPISGIWNILSETSGFVPVGGHKFVIDGDKVLAQTGIYVDDVPGKAVVVYDQRTHASSWKRKKRFIDGDQRQYMNQPLFSVEDGDFRNDEEEIVIFDCLVPRGYSCLFQNVAIIPRGRQKMAYHPSNNGASNQKPAEGEKDDRDDREDKDKKDKKDKNEFNPLKKYSFLKTLPKNN